MNIRTFWLAAICLPLAFSVNAEDKFALSDQQAKALGITLKTLKANDRKLLESYPARVILAPDQERVVSTAINAMVSSVLVQEGVLVKAGQPLLELQSSELANLQLSLIQATGKLRLAKATLEREQALLADGIIPKRRLLEAETAQQEAHAALTLARASLISMGMNPAAIQRIERTGNPETSLALSAPSDGTVSELKVHPGQQVVSSDVLMRLVRLTPVWLEIQLPLNSTQQYTPGMLLEVGQPPVLAKLMNVGAVASDNQTIVAHAMMTGESTQPLRPGQTIEARLQLPGKGWLLPQSAVIRQENQAFVFVQTKEGFESKSVKVVTASGQDLLVEGDLHDGDQVAISKTIALKGVWLGESGMGEE